MTIAVDLRAWEQARARNGTIARNVERLCFKLEELWSETTGPHDDRLRAVMRSSTFRKLQRLVPQLPPGVRPPEHEVECIVLWATLLASRLGRRTL